MCVCTELNCSTMKTTALIFVGLLALVAAGSGGHNKAIVSDECEPDLSEKGNKMLFIAFLGLAVTSGIVG